MNKKLSFYTYTINCGEEVIHTEIIKVLSVNKEKAFQDKCLDMMTRLRVVMNNILYAHDSMSFHSRVRPIRERFEATKKKHEITITFLDSDNPEEQYKHYLETRDVSLGYLLDGFILI